MTEAEFVNFGEVIKRMSVVFRQRLPKLEATELTRTYFKLLEPYLFVDVVRTARTLMQTTHRFPLVAEWLALLNARQEPPSGPNVRVMTVTEVQEYTHAERDKFAGQPCLCSDCIRAGVDDLPLRYAPITFGDGAHDLAFNQQAKRTQPAGEWLHGEALAGWYRARQAFFGLRARYPKLQRVFVMLERPREPGEEG
jgi:hypothetical protein